MTTVCTRILVIDDEPGLARTLVAIFQLSGYTASAVHSAEEALTSIAACRPSLVVSDVIMPGMDGIAMTKIIRNSYPDCPDSVVFRHCRYPGFA